MNKTIVFIMLASSFLSSSLWAQKILSPVQDSVMSYPEENVRVRWSGDKSAQYLVSIKDMRRGKVIDQRELVGNETSFKLTYPSKYQIAVRKGAEKEKIEIHYKAPVALFDPKAPFFFYDMKGDKRFKVQYKTMTLKEEGRLVAAKDEAMKTIVGTYPLTNAGQLFRAKKQGQYCFRFEGQNDDPYIVPTKSLCLKFGWESAPKAGRRIASIPKPSLDQIMTYYRIEGKDSYQFKLPRNLEAREYNVQLFRDSEGKSLYRELHVRSHKVLWRTSRDDKMFYRYRVKHKNGEYGEFSQIGELKFPISPYEI